MVVPIGEYKQAVEVLAQRMKAFYDRTVVDVEKEWEKNYIPGSKFASEVDALAQETNQEIDDKFIERFCHKAVMTLMLKFLFLRFAEDKKILKPYFRKEAIEKWQQENKETQEVIREAFEKAREKFRGLYKATVYDEFLPVKETLEIYLIDALSDEPKSGLYKGKGSLDFATLDPTVVSAFYERLFERRKRKELGLFFTPPIIAEYLVEKAFEGQKITKDFLVLDPACGSGQILLAAYRKLKDIFVNQLGMTAGEAHKQILSHNLWGVDIEPFAVLLSKINVAIQDLENVPEYINIIHGDSLLETSFDIPQMAMLKDVGEKQKQKLVKETIQTQGGKEITFWRNGFGRIFFEKPVEQTVLFELVERMKTGIFFEEAGIRTMKDLPKEFDAVVANPPYLSIKKFKQFYKEELKTHVFWGQFYRSENDILYYFLIHGLRKLRLNGKICYITAKYWLENTWADKLRKYILENSIIKLIVDFGENRLFEDAENDTLIIELEKNILKENLIKVIRHKIKYSELNFSEKLNKIFSLTRNPTMINNKDYVSFFSVLQQTLNSGKWVMSEYLKIIKKIEADSIPLGELCLIGQGVVPGDKEAFRVKKEIAQKEKLERDLLKPLITNKDIKHYYLSTSFSEYLICTIGVDDISEYPNIAKYLNQYFKRLTKERHDYYKKKYKWFQYSREQNIELFSNFKDKIICPYRSYELTFGLDNFGFWGTTDIYVIVPKDRMKTKINFLITVLNSSLTDFWYKQSGKLKGEMVEIFSTPLKKIPVKVIAPEQQKPFIEMADKMLELNKKLQETEKSLQKFVDERIKIKIPLRKIEGLNFINIKDSRAKLGDKSKISTQQEEKVIMLTINKKSIIKIICEDKISAEFLVKYLDGLRTDILSGRDGDSWIERILNTKIHWGEKPILEKLLNEYKILQFSAEQFKKEIAETDKKIDEMVYDLYGITKEERKIIEGPSH